MASVDRSTAPAKLAATPALYVMNLGPMGIAMSPGRQVMNAAAASKPTMPQSLESAGVVVHAVVL